MSAAPDRYYGQQTSRMSSPNGPILGDATPHGGPLYGGGRAAKRKGSSKALLLLMLGVCAVGAAVVAYMVTKGGDDSESASNSSGGGGGGGGGTSEGGFESGTISGGGGGGNGKVAVTTDPTAETYALHAFALGDWGQTTASNDSCCQRRKGKYNGFDMHAEKAVSKLMAIEAESHKPSVVLGHGDNFYWTGISGPTDQSYRFGLSFEDRHGEESMMDVPWINVMGNHDYGGGSYICLDDDEQMVACKNADELIKALHTKFELQSTYKSPNNDRWIMTDHFYTYSVEQDGVTMDIFNLDTNDFESHGADQICCQCYGYSEGNDTICKTAARGHEMCCDGDADMWDQCMAQFKEWGDDSRTQLVEAVQKSKATWKIVNTHYSPYGHNGETKAKEWMDTLESLGVQLWIAGHTHGEKHDYSSSGMHFIENGAGGGIQSEPASGIPPAFTNIKNVWTAGGLDTGNTYGFFSLKASSTWLKVRFMTFDDAWSMSEEKGKDGFEKSTIGGVAAKHCWYIPANGAEGQICTE